MKVYRKFFDETQEEEVTLQEAIAKLEGYGYYLPGTVEKALQEGNILQTNAAEYYIKRRED